MRAVWLLVAALVSFVASPALAWGAYGHRTVAAIAMKNVTPHTRAEIRRILHAEPQLVTPDCPVKTLEDASVWPDCVRQDGARWAYTFPWHYQNISVCRPFDIKAKCAYGNCVSAQVERNARLLADRRLPAEQRLEALMFLTHFVGDLHQPLHVGENDDLGGNRIKADYGIAPGLNLHWIWDGPEAERAISSANPPLVRRYSAAEKARFATGSVEDWARESWQVSRDFLYPAAFGTLPCAGDEADHVVWSNEAIEQAIPVVDERIERAGLRLAKMLDEALG
ncbi:S1/P1 nuclease [Novosphingobium malaysiense]|uniref:Endonuclease n=1 Tax=Novosphingobium malaysiense TaxID=1348853 RepID=A0A0B1ZW83_9SPHN|nr:S1/P1 nuclease [Novosphingobium malaysiense]KHK93443.1 endonuclease [Novosphingobium malaysiense]